MTLMFTKHDFRQEIFPKIFGSSLIGLLKGMKDMRNKPLPLMNNSCPSVLTL